MTNAGTRTATGCSISPMTVVPASFLYQTTDPKTNALVGTANTPVDIPAAGAQTFVIAFTPTEVIGRPGVEVLLRFSCANLASPARILPRVNTFTLTAATSKPPDVIAIIATPSNDGIVTTPNPGFFVVAARNIGSGGTFSVTTGGSAFGANICETLIPNSGICATASTLTVFSSFSADQMISYAVFLPFVPPRQFDPATDRVGVEFLDFGGAQDTPFIRGYTSVAVKTTVQQP